MSKKLADVIRESVSDLSLVARARRRIEENEGKYAPPQQTFPLIAARWSQVLGAHVDAADVAVCMAELKAVRIMCNPQDVDSKVDQYGYLIIRDMLDAEYNI